MSALFSAVVICTSNLFVSFSAAARSIHSAFPSRISDIFMRRKLALRNKYWHSDQMWLWAARHSCSSLRFCISSFHFSLLWPVRRVVTFHALRLSSIY